MNISGATGYTILFNKKLNKKILLFSDIHDEVNYCKNINNFINIDKFLSTKMHTGQVLLEETVHHPSLNLVDLWPNAKHTQDLKILLNNYPSKIIPVDIRPLLIPFSWQFIEGNDIYKNITLEKYLSLFTKFFNKKGLVWDKYIFSYLEFIHPNIQEKLIKIHFEQLKDDFNKKLSKFRNNILGDIYKNDYDYLQNIDIINSYIMEWYILILIFSDYRDSIIHTGLSHSHNIIRLLKESYGFNILEQKGLNDITKFNDNIIVDACIINPYNKNKN